MATQRSWRAVFIFSIGLPALFLGTAGCADDPDAAYVRSTDCTLLADVSVDFTLAQCNLCQGVACSSEPTCDQQFPCVNGKILIQGCQDDADCDNVADVAPFCGRYTGVNNVCVTEDSM